ncbi:MAG: DUF4845 domain-containing protein [Endozoicomonas sp.]
MADLRSRQKGLGALGLMSSLMAAVFIVMFLVKVLPLYVEDYTIARVVQSLDNRPGIESASLGELRSWLNKGLQTNMVTLAPGESEVSRVKGGRPAVAVNYERRVKFLYNIDLVLTFEHDWKVKSQ